MAFEKSRHADRLVHDHACVARDGDAFLSFLSLDCLAFMSILDCLDMLCRISPSTAQE